MRLSVVLPAALCGHVFAASVAVNLRANWTDSPFQVQLVEALASHNESLYVPAIKSLFCDTLAESDWGDSDEEGESFDTDSSTDEGLYKSLIRQLTETQIGFLNLNLVHSIFSPRIQAHIDHYHTEVRPYTEALVLKQCATDSFGEKIDDPLGAWVKYGAKVYCSELDLFALQLDKQSEPKLAFDRPVGSNPDAPLLTLYGSPDSQRFSGMISTLLLLAETGNLQFVWRYVPTEPLLPLLLSGYGKTLTVKSKQPGVHKEPEETGSLSEFLKRHKNAEVSEIAASQLPQVSEMLTALVLDAKPAERFEKLSLLLKNLPKYAPHLANVKRPANFKSVLENSKANENKGASRDLIGMFINGAMVHRLETDMPYIIEKLNDEIKLVELMENLGFSKRQAKKLFTKFALLSAYKENEYRAGSSHNRYSLYRNTFRADDPASGGVVFFNNLLQDDNYNLYSSDRVKVYIQEAAQYKQGQIPPLKENVHDIIFVLNFSNKSQLKVFFAMSKIILDKGIPQQLGILPLVESDKDDMITQMFYHILEVGELTEGLAFLYKYFEASPEDEESLFGLVANSSGKSHTQYKDTLRKFSITEPSVVINGVIVNMRSTKWQAQMGQQITHDVKVLQNSIRQGDDKGKPLKEVLYSGSKSSRNLRVTPKDPGNIRYKRVTPELLEASMVFKKIVDPSQTSVTLWLIGDFNSNIVLDQFIQVLKFMRQYNGRSTQVRVINTARESQILDALISKFSGQLLTSPMLRSMVDSIGDMRVQTFSKPDPAKLAVLEANSIQLHQSSLLFNSRQFRLDSVLDVRELQQILAYEFPQRLDTIDEVLNAYPEDFEYQTIIDFKPENIDDMDWYDLVTSVITESFNLEDSIVRTDVARFDFSSLNFQNSVELTDYNDEKPLDILITLDPVDEFSQRLIATVESLQDLPFLNIIVLLQPLSQTDGPSTLDRFYASGFSGLTPSFTADGHFLRAGTESFEALPDSNYRVGVDIPNRWYVAKNESSADLDLNDLSVSDENVAADFVLSKIAVEAFVRNVKTGAPVPGLILQATNRHGPREGFTMETMGYNQLRLEPGTWQLEIKNILEKDKQYDLLSAHRNRYLANDEALDSTSLSVFSLSGNLIHVRTRESQALPNDSLRAGASSAEVNVFSIASGLNYEKLMAIMMLSVKTHTKKTLKFWLLEDFLSLHFKAQLPMLAAKYDFQYELISYKWPIWLRQQTEIRRTVWAYKILFLDVLFPADLDRVIFVDADQIARTDLSELMHQDLQGAPYGFTPMCESREDMKGFRFWEQGYWKTVLKDDLKYHISALFVVDLKTFRQNAIGDKLRSHYQRLSSDPSSLSNLDQDLPNNLQRTVPIFSLPQEWLWCETWCSQALKEHAKMIDLCDDPTSLEPKIAKALRLIPEWQKYNEQLQSLGDALTIHDDL
ncbi:hypothetical protein METBIDRAFT_77411 [Metschnikowia bicuspidata var. bicuspidata NRRL YB-4993]|uniref:UDP-glucose:glycoprotein glucosyltransferase n=1 Tax=Metschnikowia bicuspidata var. bicuspidata NRRL YB-4993 TaxID=869754 RepID=A0A1A0HCM1_9ASCO|nr:hypothetical protein METBIDRAFT_77411 [Metschnikowia bicuspidata var. bicuspidata NRRL YB-4993]OBA21854.1 hypothetical protein METBIDRAFT_77411 [Metschnikowia bicuspidata var. bicuspidata NRRL YB-4993]